MKNLLLLFIPFLLVACEQYRASAPVVMTTQADSIATDSSQSTALIKIPAEVEVNQDSLIRDWAAFLRGNDTFRYDFLPKMDKKITYLKELQSSKELVRMYAYGSPAYKKYNKVGYHSTFDLFVLEYQQEAAAKIAFDSLIAATQYLVAPAADGIIHNDQQYIHVLNFDPYNGGFLVQHQQYIFSIAKTCAGNPINLPWSKYEPLFLHRMGIASPATTITSNCGDLRFEIKELTYDSLILDSK